jgi:aspartyl aminopeptidase
MSVDACGERDVSVKAFDPAMSCSAQGLINFVDASPTPFQLVAVAKAKLTQQGFTELRVCHSEFIA